MWRCPIGNHLVRLSQYFATAVTMETSSTPFGSLFLLITELGDYDSFLELLSRRRIAVPASIEAYSEELFRFLFLKGLHRNVSPSPVIDQCWHCLLLFPLLYKQTCKILLGAKHALPYAEGIIPHDPLGGDNQFARNRRYTTALTEYHIHFTGGPLVAGVWPKQYDDAENFERTPRVPKRKHGQFEDSDDVTDAAQNFQGGEVQHVAVTPATARILSALSPALPSEPVALPVVLPAAVAEATRKESEPTGKRDALGTNVFITLIVREVWGEEMLFKVRGSTALGKVMQAYVDRRGLDLEQLRFYLGDRQIGQDDTVETLGIVDGDQVHVVLRQLGC